MGGLGMEVATQVGAGALLGWLFDRWRGTAPTGLLVGAVIGIVVGLWSLIKGALKLNRELDRDTARRRGGVPDDNERADG
jgi:F0F1-type ATP synthase assembly protein I